MINDNTMIYFATADRLELEEIRIQAVKILESPEFKRLTDAMPNIFMILNAERQIVFANSRLAEFLKKEKIENIIGLRPGEVLRCIHSAETAGGCGTSESCSMCGALRATIDGLNGQFSIQECRIMTNDGTDALDLKIWASPYVVKGENYMIFAIQDISNEKRRDVLERIFFHDIINTAGGLKGMAELLKESPEDIHDFKDIIYGLAETLLEEITSQKLLMRAERNELAVSLSRVNSLSMIDSVAGYYRKQYVADGKHIVLNKNTANVKFRTDETLAKRVLGNMLKNALEAAPMDSTITLNAIDNYDSIVISVHNPTVMPREVQLQLFQRSFSTKGAGRGLGTYSMKLLMEKYLKGKIEFTSSEANGTTFFATFYNNFYE